MPPVTFVIILLAVLSLAFLSSGLAFRSKRKLSNGGRDSYACGESNYDNMAQPDYSVFFPYAFFFTLAHVATLIMTTVPTETLETLVMVLIYIIGAILGLYILFRK